MQVISDLLICNVLQVIITDFVLECTMHDRINDNRPL